MFLGRLGPWDKPGIVGRSGCEYAPFVFRDLVQDFFCPNQGCFPDVGFRRVYQVGLVSLDKLHDFGSDRSSDQVDNRASMISDTKFGLLGQLVKSGEIIFHRFLALF